MAKIAVVTLVRDIAKCVVLGSCCLSILWGCSSRGQTTIMSKHEPKAPPVAQVQQTDPPEEVVMQHIKVEPTTVNKQMDIPEEKQVDIPVEEPAKPLIRQEPVSEIFATPKTEVPSPLTPVLTEDVSEVEPVSPPADLKVDASGIPPADFEPELPATPTIRAVQEEEQPPIQVAKEEQSPIQVAKVVPQVPEDVEIVEEDLVQALGDVFFDYDRFTIREDAVPMLTNNANLLTASLADKKIVIEGHCDERGTRSYNMILGERRAQAVKMYLEDLGVPGDKLQVVSYGKDKPFCTESSQDCWQENRRGHFVLK